MLREIVAIALPYEQGPGSNMSRMVLWLTRVGVCRGRFAGCTLPKVGGRMWCQGNPAMQPDTQPKILVWGATGGPWGGREGGAAVSTPPPPPPLPPPWLEWDTKGS